MMVGMPKQKSSGAPSAPAVTPAPTPARTADSSTDGAGLREQRRRHRAQVSRDHILDVAERLFGDHGYRATSLEEVAAGSEFSVGALYTFFASKKDLLAAVLARRHDEMRAAITELVGQSLPGLDELLCLCSYYLDYFRQHPSFGRLTLRVYPAGLEPIADLAEYVGPPTKGNELFIRAVRRGQQEGTIVGGDPAWLATLVLGMIMFDHSLRYEASAEQVPTSELLAVIRSAIAEGRRS
jgi:AcrR family transcriptional regulator